MQQQTGAWPALQEGWFRAWDGERKIGFHDHQYTGNKTPVQKSSCFVGLNVKKGSSLYCEEPFQPI
jgi:hypothetical protein